MAEAARSQSEPEQFILKEVAALKAMADPLRMQITLELGEQALTVKQVAERLDVPVTRLYYHFKILERAGLIRVVETRLVSGIEERQYQAVATNFGPDPESPESVSVMVTEGIFAAMLDVVRAELELALTSTPTEPVGTIGDSRSTVPMLSYTRWLLSPEEAEDVQDRLVALVTNYGGNKPAPERRAYNALLTWYKAPEELRKQAREGSDAS